MNGNKQTADQMNKAAIELWEKHFSADADVWIPLLYPPIIERSLLFIGLNPSFSNRGFGSILKGTEYELLDPEEFYHWRNISKLDWDVAIRIEELSVKREGQPVTDPQVLRGLLAPDLEKHLQWFAQAGLLIG